MYSLHICSLPINHLFDNISIMFDKKEVKHIAKLARLGLTEKEEEMFQKDFSSILDYFNLLKEVDVKDVKPTFHPTEDFLGKELREDVGEKQDFNVEQAPEKEKRYIKVKAIF